MGTNKNLNRLALSAAIAGILMSGTVMAQDAAQPQGTTTTTTTAPATATQKNAQQPASANNAQTLQQVVVTGTANGGLKKIDASYSITTATAQQMKEANPKSVADPVARPARISKSPASRAAAMLRM